MIETMRANHIRTLRALGLPARLVVARALRGALLPDARGQRWRGDLAALERQRAPAFVPDLAEKLGLAGESSLTPVLNE